MERKNQQKTIRDSLTEFLAEKRAMGLAQPTLDNYITTLQIFMSENGWDDLEPVSSLNKDCIIKWIQERLSYSSNPQSINHYLRDLRAFCYWNMNNGYLEPFKINMVRAPEPATRRYSEDDLEALLVPPMKSDCFSHWRSWLLVNIVMATGARLGSIINLKVEDVDIPGTSITFTRTKNKQILILPLSESLKSAILKYLREWDINSRGYLLCSSEGQSATPHSIQQAFQQYCNDRMIDYRGIHALRHSFSYLMYKSGADIATIGYYLGHSIKSIATTRNYIGRLTKDDIRPSPIPLDCLLTQQKNRVKRK